MLNKDTSSSTAVTNGLQRNSSFYNAYYYKDSGIDQITKFTYGNYKAFNNSIISDTFGNITSTAYDVRVDASFLIKAVALEINMNTEGTSASGLGYLNEPTSEDLKLFDDNATYLGNQLKSEFDGDRCFGIVANMDFILIATYEEKGENPELVIYKKR